MLKQNNDFELCKRFNKIKIGGINWFLYFFLTSAIKWLWQQLTSDPLGQNISPQHCQWFAPESWGESFLLPVSGSHFHLWLHVGSPLFPLHLLCPHRLSSRSSPPAGTLPKTRKLGRRSLSTTATRWMQTTPKRSIRHILIKREWKHIQSVVLLPITVTCKCGQHGCIVAWIRTSIWDGVHLFFPPAGLRWSYSLH